MIPRESSHVDFNKHPYTHSVSEKLVHIILVKGAEEYQCQMYM